MNEVQLSKPIQRRAFLARASAFSLAVPFVARSVHSSTDASQGRLRIASIGVGGMGASDLAALSSHKQAEIVAICDVDALRLAAAGEKHPNAKRFSDYRVMLDQLQDSVDAVQVSTPDHTHAPASLLAMSRGKHVYCQKPLTHDVFESRQMRLLSQQKGVVSQMGTQVHSNTDYRTAVALVQSGVIGKVKEVHSWSSKTWGYEGPEPIASPVPATLDWDLWLGTANPIAYSDSHYHPANWRRWYDFGCGTMGDMAIHILDPVFSALKLGAPSRVVSSSPEPPKRSYGMKNQTRYTFGTSPFTTDGFVLTWSDGGMMPDTNAWPKQKDKEGKDMALPDQGSMFVGEKGYILLPHVAQPILLPASDFAKTAIQRQPNGNHYHLFVDACLGGAPTTANFGYAGPLTEAVLLGVLANRFPQQELQWNAEAMSIPNHAVANALLRRKYRDGFAVDVPIS